MLLSIIDYNSGDINNSNNSAVEIPLRFHQQ